MPFEAGQETAVGVGVADEVEDPVELDVNDAVELDPEEMVELDVDEVPVEELAELEEAELEEDDDVVCWLSLAPQIFTDFTAAPTELLR